MKLDSVLDAKATVFKKAFGFQEVLSAQLSQDDDVSFSPVQGTEAYDAIQTAKRHKIRDSRELVAIGVIPGMGRADRAKMAILVQRKRLVNHPLVERALRLLAGEADIIVTGPAVRHGPANAGHHRPLKIGASVGHYRATAGTLGCFVKCRRSGELGMLSNNHVLANSNRGVAGDVILHPGRIDCEDCANPIHNIATLTRYIPFDYRANAVNLVDCAFATLHDAIDFDAVRVDDLSGVGWTVQTPAELLLPEIGLKKMGRTTGLTTGRVAVLSIDNICVTMVNGDPRTTARFDKQIAIRGDAAAFSKAGDSGSVVFTTENNPVGLLFAGTRSGKADGANLSYVNPIGKVLDLLDLELHRL